MTHEFFLEIGAEEIPAGFQQPALAFLQDAAATWLTESRVSFGDISTCATPRRLALHIDAVAAQQQDLEEVKTGPPARISFDADGNPTRAAQGFARGAGASVDDLFTVTTPKGEYLAVRVQHRGVPTLELLSEWLPNLLKSIPFRKSQRWGDTSVTFARPVRWLCALFGENVVPFSYGNVTSSNVSYGHRFMSPEPFEVTSFASYREILSARNVILDPETRRNTIRTQLAAMGEELGGVAVPDEELIHEVANLCEDLWGGTGHFDPENLKLPREVLISSMRKHQRYFAFEDPNGNLLPVFGVFNNTRVRDPKVVLHGNERVLKARLHDGAFFFNEDRKRRLEDRLNDLERVTFLGELSKINQEPNLLARTHRLQTLAQSIAALAYPDDTQVAQDASRAALLSKTDLPTLMVGEFPDLQGVIGMYYARLDGENDAVADAIGQQYQPRGQHDAPPSTPVGVCLALADKLELLVACFAVSLIPSGNKDPYGLRRATLGVLRTLDTHQLDLDLNDLVGAAIALFYPEGNDALLDEITAFIGGRLRADLTAQARTDIVEAVLASGFNRPLHVRKRVEALTTIDREADLAPIGEAFKRIHNILQKNADQIDSERAFSLEDSVEEAETQLGSLSKEIRTKMDVHLSAADYQSAFGLFPLLRDPLESFFNHVMVMHEDPKLRANRLALLSELRQTFESLADVSRIHVAS